MITDARVLRTEFVPRDVVHRDPEVQYLSSVLEPILDGQVAEPSFLHGKSGTGKTVCARFTVERLREQVVDLDTQYVNCWRHRTRFRVLLQLLEGIDRAFDVHRQSTPRDVLLDRLVEYDGTRYVVILDEVDQLEDKDLLYDLYRVSNITLILIANHEHEVFAQFDQRVASRLSNCIRIRFSPYTTHELVSILRDRVKWGLAPDVVTETQLERIADAAAGDARTAIGILRNAATQAQSSNLDTITDTVIKEAIPVASTEIRETDLNRLTNDQRALYEIIANTEAITPRDLYEEYEATVDRPKSRRQLRNYLSKMQHYNLIEAVGETRGRVYRVTGKHAEETTST